MTDDQHILQEGLDAVVAAEADDTGATVVKPSAMRPACRPSARS